MGVDCTCPCDDCLAGDCEECDHVGCDAEAENCEDCPMAMRTMTRDLPPLSLRAMVAPGTVNEARRTVDVVWTTGARVLRGGFDQFYEELSLDPKHVRMERLNAGAPLLAAHDDVLGAVIGVVESARIEPGHGVATVRFARAEDDPDADKIFRKVRDGIVRNVSVGYRIHKMDKVEDAGETPVYRAVDWTPYELSIVPIGADAGATVRDADGAPNPCTFTGPQENKMPTATSTAAAANATANTVTVTPDEVRAAGASAERERIQALTRTGSAHKLDTALVNEHIGKGTSADEFRRLAEVEFEKRTAIPIGSGGDQNQVRIVAGEDQHAKFQRGATAWMLQRGAMSDTVVAHAKLRAAAGHTVEKVELDPGEFRGMTLLDLARHCLEMNGVSTRGMVPLELVGKAFTHSRAAIGVGAASTSDFPMLLESVLYKTLLAAYGTTPDTWTEFCALGSVNDFRPTKRYRMGTFGALSVVNEGGEFPNKPIPDATRESITAQTKGNIIAITRQAIINDDMGAFSRLASMLGRSARLSIELDVYALLALNSGLGPVMSDGLTLFHATHGNLTTGAALTAAALDLDRIAMATQQDVSKNEILDLRPDILLLPVGLGGLARQIIHGQFNFDALNKFMIPNPVLSLVSKIIDSPRVTGTRRYLFASPSIAPTFEVVFLDGQQAPYMESQMGWRIDGQEWKVRLDYGMNAIDYRGAITNAGV